MSVTAILWRRLDLPGHDACRVEQHASGWELDGSALFLHERRSARLSYHLSCDREWRATRGQVRGWLGSKPVSLDIMRANGRWIFNGDCVSGVERMVDLDYGFTPATNLPQLRRMNLSVGQAADAPVAWLDITTGALVALNQRYERRSENTWWYAAPTFEYSGLLETNTDGFISHYPGLWEEER